MDNIKLQMDNVHKVNKTITHFYSQLQNHLNYNVAVLDLAGVELTFFHSSLRGTVLWIL